MDSKDKNKIINKSKDKLFPRWLLFGMGSLVTLSYLEFNVFQLFRDKHIELEMLYELGNILILLLVIPVVAFVMVPLIDKANEIANRRVIFIKIGINSIYVKRFDCDYSEEYAAEFSQRAEIIADTDKLAKAVNNALRDCFKNTKFAISPFVVFTAVHQLSKVQLRAAELAIREAGALDVKYIEDCSSDSEALEFARQNPISRNFA